MFKSFKLLFLSSFFGLLAGASIVYPIFSYYSLLALAPLFYFLQKEKKIISIFSVVLPFQLGLCFVVMIQFVFEPLLLIWTAIIFGLFAGTVFLAKRYLKGTYFLILLPVLYLVFEFIEVRTSLFPADIVMIGNALAPTYFLSLAKIAGVYGLGAIVVFSSALLVYLFVDLKNKKRKILLWPSLILILIVTSFFIKNFLNESNKDGKTLKIAAVSLHTTRFDLYILSKEEMEKIKNELKENLRKNISGPIDYVFLPNDALPFMNVSLYDDQNLPKERYPFIDFASRDEKAFEKFGISNNGGAISFYGDLAKELDVKLAVGLPVKQNGKNYNSILYFDERGDLLDVYHKHDLVIGSEYWPFNSTPFYWRWTRRMPIGGIKSRFSPSENPHFLIGSDNEKIGVVICSEAEKPELYSLAKKRGAKMIFAAVNHDWRLNQKSDLFNYRQPYLNVLRINSLYNQLPIILSGKNNFAGIIFPDGTMDLKTEDREAFNGLETNQIGYVIFQGRIKL